ncbi:MAG: ribosome maturation factor RimM [Acidobacteriota bacterium]
MSAFVSIARIVKVRGLKGELAAELLTDFPERFEGLEQVRVEGRGGISQEILESYRFHQGRVLLKFQGRDTPDAARLLLWSEVQVPEEQRFPLPADVFYHSDLIGCEVRDARQALGRVVDVLETGGGPPNLVVESQPAQDQPAQEWMLPLVRAFIQDIDLEKKTIRAEPPPGLLDLKSPGGGWHLGKRKRQRIRRKKGRGKNAPEKGQPASG